jgi:trk system potassium uptake protein
MHVILIGGNKTVYFLARQFVAKNYHTVIINRDYARAKELAQQTKATVVHGEGTDISRLEEAGARRADLLLALTSHDQDNLIACQIGQKNFKIPRTIALVNDPDNEAIFKQLGVTIAFSATRIIGSIIDQETDFETITDIIPLAKGRVTITDVHLDTDSPAVGKTLQDLNLSSDSLVGAIIRDDQVIVPRGATELHSKDHLILISTPEKQGIDLALLCNPRE